MLGCRSIRHQTLKNYMVPSKLWTRSFFCDHLLLPAMVLHKDRVADHDVAEGCDGDRNQPVTGDGHMQEEGELGIWDGLLRQFRF